MANEVGTPSFTKFVLEGKLCVVSGDLHVGKNVNAALTSLSRAARDESALIVQAPFQFEDQTLEGLFLSRPKINNCIPVITFRVLKMRGYIVELLSSFRAMGRLGADAFGGYEPMGSITVSFDDIFLIMMSL